MVCERWQNQQEALDFSLSHHATMLDMDMGTGKTRVAIDTVFAREDVYRVLVVCPKRVMTDGVWRKNLEKFAPDSRWACLELTTGNTNKKLEELEKWVKIPASKQFVIVNYDTVWRKPIGDWIVGKGGFQMVILDESHRAKAAGSKVSKYLALLGKRVHYRMCLSGTPMAHSPLDIYGQYRFLDSSIFGTNYSLFLQQYAIMGGPERRFVVGFMNQKDLNAKFRTIAYSCKMEDIKDRIKLPDALPTTQIMVDLPAKDMKTMKELNREFVAECGKGHVIANTVLTVMTRLQQITSGFCPVRESIFEEAETQELNTAKMDALIEYLSDISPLSSVVVFCVFRHDLASIEEAAKESKRKYFEVSGDRDDLEDWRKNPGGVIGVQIQAGAEGIDMTIAHHAVYFSIPRSLALYNQSRARIYRPGQTSQVSFTHIIARNTIDESLYKTLERREDIIDAIRNGTFDIGYLK